MDIGVANPAVLDVDGDIVLLRLAPFEHIWGKRSLRSHRGVALRLAHDFSLLMD
jgi:hypothetical protein